MTFDFIEAVPDDRWEFSPHPCFAALHKQVRHLVCVQGVYTQGLRERVADFGKKHTHYDGPLDQSSLVGALRAKDAELAEALAEIRASGDLELTIEFYGKQSLSGFLQVYATHESLHHGQWSFYAALGEFETPQSWKLNWAL